MNKKLFIISLMLLTLVAIQLYSVPVYAVSSDDNAYETKFTNPVATSTDYPNLVVQVLRYEKYPVTSGDSFTLWVKVQNIGQESAPDAVFTLQPEYPFSSEDSLVREYGIIDGTMEAYKVDQTYDSTNVILKYIVKVAEDTPTGTYNLKFTASPNKKDSSTIGITKNLPIEIFSGKEISPAQCSSTPVGNIKWVYGIIGLITGAFIIILLRLIKQKRALAKHSSH